MMQIVVDIPDSLAGPWKGDKDVSRRVREALAVEGYVSGALTRGQVAELLGMTFYEAEAWFARKGIHRNYDLGDLEADRKTLDRLLPGS
jgi:predicted HTH domain antitoxin